MLRTLLAFVPVAVGLGVRPALERR